MIKIYILSLVSSFIFSASIDVEIATHVAKNIFFENINLHSDDTFNVSSVEKIKHQEKDLIYIFHLDPKGFIMIPADDQAMPDLAFSFENSFNSQNMPPNLNALINYYKIELSNMISNQNPPIEEILDKWSYYLKDNIEVSRDRDVSPLLDARFDQGGSWNNGIQAAIGFNGPVGCVAVAMCQVMHYWGYPESGLGSNFYTENDYGYIEVDFEDAFYDFNNMAATYATTSSQLLLFHAGVSVNMDYDWSGSGAQVVGSYPSAFYAMENFFGYDSDISYRWKDSFDNVNEYRDMIKDELDNNRPIIAQGYGSGYGGGHAWNIDGYAGNNLHCNWGWGGSSNGYFNLTSMGGFPDDQAVIVGIIPPMYTSPFALYEYTINDLTVSFQDLSQIINETSISSWIWDFGDGNTSFSSSPTHTYSQGGVYEVSLIISNLYGQESEPHIELLDLSFGLSGDVNSDQVVNILDIVLLVNFVLGTDTPSSSQYSAADLNSDGTLNILDVVTLTNEILGD